MDVRRHIEYKTPNYRKHRHLWKFSPPKLSGTLKSPHSAKRLVGDPSGDLPSKFWWTHRKVEEHFCINGNTRLMPGACFPTQKKKFFLPKKRALDLPSNLLAFCGGFIF